jgi:hypothetical protein
MSRGKTTGHSSSMSALGRLQVPSITRNSWTSEHLASDILVTRCQTWPIMVRHTVWVISKATDCESLKRHIWLTPCHSYNQWWVPSGNHGFGKYRWIFLLKPPFAGDFPTMFDYQMVWLMKHERSQNSETQDISGPFGLESGHLSESNGDSETFQTQMLHVWNIYLHLVDFWGKCR